MTVVRWVLGEVSTIIMVPSSICLGPALCNARYYDSVSPTLVLCNAQYWQRVYAYACAMQCPVLT
eukprot:3028764-Rhodomonas_salina.4